MLIQTAFMFPAFLWLTICSALYRSKAYEMDHGNGTAKGTFFPLMIMYSAFFYALIALDVFGAVYARSQADWRAGLVFLFAAIEALLFNILIVFFYESWLHVRYPGGDRPLGPSNYTRGKYALILSLSASSVLTTIAAALWTATTLR